MTLPSKRLAVEAVPVAAILLFWNLLAWVAQFQNVGGAVGSAGVVMATLYVVVRGLALSDRVVPPASVDMEAVLMANVRVAVPAGAWFVAAMVVAGLEAWLLGLRELLAIVTSALASTGLGVVALYAVAAGVAAFRRNAASGATASGVDGPADDGASDAPGDD